MLHILQTRTRTRTRTTGKSQRRHWAAPLGIALALLAGGCGDDNDTRADAGPDAAVTQCKPADCAGIALPTMQVCMVGTATFTCARNIDGRCIWTQPRCSTTTSDAAVDLAPIDGGSGDDATAMPDAADDATTD
jgi:hypothetical protein